MGQLNAVMSELESLGALGGEVTPEPVPEAVEPEPAPVLHMVPPPRRAPDHMVPAGDFSERMKLVHEVCEESLQKLAIVAKQVQDLQRVFTQLLDVTRLEEGERDAQIHQEA